MGRRGSVSSSWITITLFTTLVLINTGLAFGYIVLTMEDEPDHMDIGVERSIRSTPTIIIAEGEIGIRDEISLIHLFIQLYGNEGIDMRDLVIKIASEPSDGDPIVQMFLLEIQDRPGDPGFTVEEVHDPLDAWAPDATPPMYILSEWSQLKLTFDLEEDLITLPPDSKVEILMHVATTGVETFEAYHTPDAYPSSGTVMLED